jgi:hypothetical protein
MAENLSLVLQQLIIQVQQTEDLLNEMSRIRLALSELTDLDLSSVVSSDLEEA